MFDLKIIPDDGDPFSVTTTSRDIAAWERGGKNRSMGRLAEDLRITDITDMAWYAADRRGLTHLDIVQWRAGVDIDFALLEDKKPAEDEAGPDSAGADGAEPAPDPRYSLDARELDAGDVEAGGPTWRDR
jgi:hypothetical protein